MEYIGDDNINWDDAARNAWERKNEIPNLVLEYFTDLLPENFSVLDMGCNIANWYIKLKGVGAGRYVGIDASLTGIELAKKRYPNERFDLCKLQDMQFEEDFDLAFCHTVLQHTNINSKRAILPKIWKALKPGGIFVFEEKCDVETPTTFTVGGWIQFVSKFGFKFIKFVEYSRGVPINGFVFQKIEKFI